MVSKPVDVRPNVAMRAAFIGAGERVVNMGSTSSQSYEVRPNLMLITVKQAGGWRRLG